MKALESFRNRRSTVWDRYSASHTRNGAQFSGLSPLPFWTPIWPTKVSSGPDSEPHMSNTMNWTYMKALESFLIRREYRFGPIFSLDARKGCTIYKSFSLAFLNSCLAKKIFETQYQSNRDSLSQWSMQGFSYGLIHHVLHVGLGVCSHSSLS